MTIGRRHNQKIRRRIKIGTATKEELHEYITKTKTKNHTQNNGVGKWTTVSSVHEVVKTTATGQEQDSASDQPVE